MTYARFSAARRFGILETATPWGTVTNIASNLELLLQVAQWSIMIDDETEGAPLGVWLLLSFVACCSFWCQATVTEERFVPALNLIATEFSIPDDVAGATLMAAGASSPELFSSIVSLFITHSALGLGTIVGSEIFNQLVICAGAVYAARSGQLKLDKAILVREVGFYGLSIAVLFWALHDQRPADDDDEMGPDHIYISFHEALVMFACYVLYVLVCAKFDAVLAFVKRESFVSKDGGTSYGSMGKRLRSKSTEIQIPRMPFLTEMDNEPSGNFSGKAKVEELYRTTTGGSKRGLTTKLKNLLSFGESVPSKGPRPSDMSQISRPSDLSRGDTASLVPDTPSERFSDGASIRLFQLQVHAEKPSDQHELYDIEMNAFSERLSCFLWQRSYFYDKARFAVHGWHLRWFTFTHDAVYSVPDRIKSDMYRMTYPRFKQVEVDEDRLILKIKNPAKGKRSYYLMAPSPEILEKVVAKIEAILEFRSEHPEIKNLTFPPPPSDVSLQTDAEKSADEPSLIEFPFGASCMGIFFFLVLYPLRLLMHLTVPDVRHLDQSGNPTSSLMSAYAAVVACLIWLIFGSYCMVASLEDLADLMGIPEAVIGFTVSAAGTSLPNYVASKVAAQKGFGNMAVSNAFGSNTFNILVGLGLPWVLYTSFGTNFEPYHGLRNDGILESVIILGSVLLLFVAIVLHSDFVLYRWHGNLFVGLYVAYIVFAVAQVYF